MNGANSASGAPGPATAGPRRENGATVRPRRQCSVSILLTRAATASEEMADQRHQEQDQEDVEQDLGDADRRAREAGEAQDGGDQGDHQEGYGPIEHWPLRIARE